MINKITPSVDQNYWLKSMYANQNSLKVPKVFKPTNRLIWFKTLGTIVIYSPMSPPSLPDYLTAT